MTIESTTFRTDWLAADGVTKDWPYEFTMTQQEHVRVEVRDSAGVIVETTADLALFATDDTEGFVRYPVVADAIEAGNDVRISRLVPYVQTTAIGNEGAFRPNIHERAFDNLAIQIQQVNDKGERALKVAPGEGAGPVLSLEDWVEGMTLEFDANGNLIPAEGLSDAVEAAEAAADLAEGHATTAGGAATAASGFANAAEAAKDEAEALVGTIETKDFATRALAEAFAPIAPPSFIRLNGYTAAADAGEAALYMLVGAEPSHSGKFSITLADAVTVVWYEIAENEINPIFFGADSTGVASVTAAVTAALSVGRPLKVTAGTYHYATAVNPPDGMRLVIKGQHRDLVTFTAAQGINPILCRRGLTGERLSSFHIEGITFDGQAVRQTFPYTAFGEYTSYGMLQGFNVRFKHDEFADAVIKDCRFKDIPNLPFWCAHARGSVICDGNIFSRTKDAGILYCNNVRYTNNTVRFSADNGISISRSNQNLEVSGNTFFGCQGNSIFVGGITLTQTATMTLTGAAYTNGSTLTAALSGTVGEGWTTEDIGTTFKVVGAGATFTICRVVSVESSTSATVICLLNVPASLQGAAAVSWEGGPQAGAANGSVHNNSVLCSGHGGLWGSLGTSKLRIHDNDVTGAGIHLDSEVMSRGTIVSSANSLPLADATGFSIGDWVAMIPEGTNEEPFFAEITNKVGNVLTLASNAPKTIADTEVYRAVKNTGASYAITLTGMFESSGYLQYASGHNVHDNLAIDCVDGGYRLGSSSGSGRRSKIKDNTVRYANTQVAIAAAKGILITEHSTDMRCSDIEVEDNLITMPTGGSTIGICYDPIDTSDSSLIHLGPNRISAADTAYRVRDQTTLTDITAQYNVVNKNTRLGHSLIVGDIFANSGWVAGNVVANDMTVTNSFMSLSAAATINVFRVLTGTANRPFFFLRNASSTDSITLTHSAGLRCPGGVNYVVGPRSGVIIAMIDATNSQVMGSAV